MIYQTRRCGYPEEEPERIKKIKNSARGIEKLDNTDDACAFIKFQKLSIIQVSSLEKPFSKGIEKYLPSMEQYYNRYLLCPNTYVLCKYAF